MKGIAKQPCLTALAAMGVLMFGAMPAVAQRDSVPCSAFARGPAGAWRVLGPVMLDLDGRLYSPTVGTVFPAGARRNGIAMSAVLDRQCGSR